METKNNEDNENRINEARKNSKWGKNKCICGQLKWYSSKRCAHCHRHGVYKGRLSQLNSAKYEFKKGL